MTPRWYHLHSTSAPILLSRRLHYGTNSVAHLHHSSLTRTPLCYHLRNMSAGPCFDHDRDSTMLPSPYHICTSLLWQRLHHGTISVAPLNHHHLTTTMTPLWYHLRSISESLHTTTVAPTQVAKSWKVILFFRWWNSEHVLQEEPNAASQLRPLYS